MPAPSPSTKPSRSRSKGREALVGSSLLVLKAVSRLKPVTPKGWIMVCVPPASITSASPRRMISAASPMAWLLAAQAVRQLMFGPWASNRLARWPAGMLGSCSSSAMGCRVSRPRLVNLARSIVPSPSSAATIICGEAVEVLLPLAAAGVDAEAGRIEAAVQHAGIGHGLLGGADGEMRMPALVLPVLRVARPRRTGPSRGPRPRSWWGSCWRQRAWYSRRPSPRGAGASTRSRCRLPAA